MQPLLVAAGGGGDAIAAALLAGAGARPVIATWAWDRLSVDPLPGPRSSADFDHLDNPAPDVFLVKPATRPRPPAGSTLPALAAALDADLLLLDPSQGCRGLSRQLDAAVQWCAADRITVVDVGGDILGRPADPGLRSPLADITALVAVASTHQPADLVVLGPGCDGELTPALVCKRLTELGAHLDTVVSPEQARAVLPILAWHNSEATALVVAAALGYRGQVEIRDQGLPVELTDDTASRWHLPVERALPPPEIVAAVHDTDSLLALERAFADLYGTNEVDYERRKAALTATERSVEAEEVNSFLAAAADRGITWVTRRRLREALHGVPHRLREAVLIPTDTRLPVRQQSKAATRPAGPAGW